MPRWAAAKALNSLQQNRSACSKRMDSERPFLSSWQIPCSWTRALWGTGLRLRFNEHLNGTACLRKKGETRLTGRLAFGHPVLPASFSPTELYSDGGPSKWCRPWTCWSVSPPLPAACIGHKFSGVLNLSGYDLSSDTNQNVKRRYTGPRVCAYE